MKARAASAPARLLRLARNIGIYRAGAASAFANIGIYRSGVVSVHIALLETSVFIEWEPVRPSQTSVFIDQAPFRFTSPCSKHQYLSSWHRFFSHHLARPRRKEFEICDRGAG